MFTIRTAQLQALAEAADLKFVRSVAESAGRWFSRPVDDALLETVREAVGMARQLGFTAERDLARFTAMTVALGAGFHEQAWARRILDDPRRMPPSRRMQLLMDRALEVSPLRGET